MKHRDIQLLRKVLSQCKDIIRYTNEIGEKGFLENDVYQKATKIDTIEQKCLIVFYYIFLPAI